MRVIIRDHDTVTESDNVHSNDAASILDHARRAADTFGSVFYYDADVFSAHCHEHTDRTNLEACFAGTIVR